MKINRVKIFAAVTVIFSLLAIVVLNVSSTRAFELQDDAAKTFTTKCAMCHKKDASKFFDGTLPEEELVEAIMKGKKGEKPPNMPGYEAKGMTEEQAQALVSHMKELAGVTDEDADANTNTAEDPEPDPDPDVKR